MGNLLEERLSFYDSSGKSDNRNKNDTGQNSQIKNSQKNIDTDDNKSVEGGEADRGRFRKKKFRAEKSNDSIKDNRKKQKKEQDAEEKKDSSHVKRQKASEHFAPELRNEAIDSEATSPLTDEDIKELEALEEMASQESFLKSEKREKRKRRFVTILFSIACAYLVILIYGTFVTEFKYNEKGVIVPVELSVKDIALRNEYSEVVGYYLQLRSLYESILTLDYRMAAGVEDPIVVAPEYEEQLDTIDVLVTQLDGVVWPTKYNQILEMMTTWVKTHAAVYCQFVSTAFSQNDSHAEQEAIAARQVVYTDFQLITRNIVSLGSEVDGFDLTDISSWSPENFVAESIEGEEAS